LFGSLINDALMHYLYCGEASDFHLPFHSNLIFWPSNFSPFTFNIFS
jgi:hypothetical protein